MTIKQIVLDVLRKLMVGKIYKEWYNFTYPDLSKSIVKGAAKKCVEQIAEDVETKIQAVSIDREELKDVIAEFTKDKWSSDNLKEINNDKVRWYTDKILSLLKPVETLDRGEVEKILGPIIKEHPFGHNWKERITQICNLAKPKLNENILKRGKEC